MLDRNFFRRLTSKFEKQRGKEKEKKLSNPSGKGETDNPRFFSVVHSKVISSQCEMEKVGVCLD